MIFKQYQTISDIFEQGCTMLAEERLTKIVMILKERGFAQVEDLAQKLHVSDMTIRRDLDKCRQRGIVRRCHGGAMFSGANRQEISYEDKCREHQAVKKSIAEIAAGFVKERMTVFLDAGTTTFEIAQQIKKIPRLTIATNDVYIIHSLLAFEPDLIFIGGNIQKKTGSAVGGFAEQMAQRMHFDVSFFGAHSINDCFDVMTPTLEKLFLKNRLAENSSATYLAADHSKFNKTALYQIDNLSDYTGVITDYRFSVEEQRLVEQKQIRTFPVFEQKEQATPELRVEGALV
ncbi:MAG: DeoR/GlpR family DNA-binding transcription regulator [Spirochaetaceae bacterium]|jgi:DeoR/GlpR family transcriptional regulator of sugar metabolism|nr:DeoR/GlpR family DNA-binding transcription regulator [Spirochaetaceae bacterium]